MTGWSFPEVPRSESTDCGERNRYKYSTLHLQVGTVPLKTAGYLFLLKTLLSLRQLSVKTRYSFVRDQLASVATVLGSKQVGTVRGWHVRVRAAATFWNQGLVVEWWQLITTLPKSTLSSTVSSHSTALGRPFNLNSTLQTQTQTTHSLISHHELHASPVRQAHE